MNNTLIKTELCIELPWKTFHKFISVKEQLIYIDVHMKGIHIKRNTLILSTSLKPVFQNKHRKDFLPQFTIQAEWSIIYVGKYLPLKYLPLSQWLAPPTFTVANNKLVKFQVSKWSTVAWPWEHNPLEPLLFNQKALCYIFFLFNVLCQLS